jgi:hypothetical protein
MSVVDFTFKTFETLLQPVCWVKYGAYSLGSLKSELCSFLNSYYQVDSFKPEDHAVRVYILGGGFYIYNKKSKDVIASSPDMKSKFLEIKLDKMQSKEFPKSQLTELNKFFTVDENISLWHVDSKIDQIRHTITLSPHKTKEYSLEDDETVYTDVCIIKRGDGTVTSLYKELYDFSFMHGNRLSLANYANNYNIEDIFNDILQEKNAVV